MKPVDLKDIIYFTDCNAYTDCNSAGRYYFSKADNEIYDSEKISAELSISETEFKDNCWHYGYIPLPKLNLSAVIDEFIESLNNKKVSEYFKNFDREDTAKFWDEFDKAFPAGFERRLWDEFYDRYIHEKVVSWCKEYGVRYTNTVTGI